MKQRPVPKGQRRWRELLTQSKAAKPSKYRAVKTTVDGIRFDSKKEAKLWQNLRILEARRLIWNLTRQEPHSIAINGVYVCDYRSDFEWDEEDDTGVTRHVVADCKGYRTRVYRLKRTLMKAVLGIEIQEL